MSDELFDTTNIDEWELHETSGKIGKRIRKIREAHIPPMNQVGLAERVGLTANRVRQYENGVRNPKFDIAQKFADALDVDVNAILEPYVDHAKGAMYAFFEMEEPYSIVLKEMDGQVFIGFRDDPAKTESIMINRYLTDWYRRKLQMSNDLVNATRDEQRDFALQEYQKWKWNFPNYQDKLNSVSIRRDYLKEKIEEMQKELKILEEQQ